MRRRGVDQAALAPGRWLHRARALVAWRRGGGARLEPTPDTSGRRRRGTRRHTATRRGRGRTRRPSSAGRRRGPPPAVVAVILWGWAATDRASAAAASVAIIPSAVTVSRRGQRRRWHSVPALIPLLPPTVLLSPAQTIPLPPLGFPLLLLRLPLCPLLFPLPVSLLSFGHPTLPQLLLLLLVEGVSLVIVAASAKRTSHLVELILLRGSDTMSVRGFERFRIDMCVSLCKQLIAELIDLFLDLFFVDTV